MKTGAHISASQWFWLLLSGRLSQCLLLPSDSLHTASIPDLAVVIVLNATVLMILLWPTTHVLRQTGGNLAELYGPRWGRAVNGLYAVLGLFVMLFDVCQLTDFARATAHADFPVALLGGGLVVTALAAAIYGIQAVGRTATVVGVTGTVILVILLVSSWGSTDYRCFPPSVMSDTSSLLSRTVRELPRTAEIATMGALYPYINGHTARTTRRFVVCASLVTLMVCLTTTGVLGDAVNRSPYPFYTAVTALPIRWDLLVIVLWLGTSFMRMALFGTVFLDSIRRLCGARWRLLSAGLAAIVLIALSVWSSYTSFTTLWKVMTYVYSGLLLAVCVGIPLGKRRMV